MKYELIPFESLGVSVQLSSFCPEGGAGEWHAMLHVEPRGDLFQSQYDRLIEAERRLLSRDDIRGARVIFKRYFLSDGTNQQPLMHDEPDTCTVSCIQQPPLDGSKLNTCGLWA